MAELVTLKSNGWTHEQVADKFNVSIRTVSRKLRLTEDPKPRKLKPCGTEAAYRRHRRHGEYPCGRCLAAHVDYNRPR